MQMKRYHVEVHGNVQGVGFRQFTQSEAVKHNIHGWVRNKSNGAVEIEAEGTPQDMDRFLVAVQEGSPFSTVERLETSDLDSVDHNESFDVRF